MYIYLHEPRCVYTDYRHTHLGIKQGRDLSRGDIPENS